MRMAKLRHIAVVVKDLEKAAAFYEKVFELKRVGEEHLEMGSGIYLSDGVINLALLKYKGESGSGLKDAADFVGAHHFGFQVDDLEAAKKKIEAAGGKFFFTLGKSKEEANFEVKYKDPDGVINLALLKYKGESGSGLKGAENFVGAHHFGFQVDDVEATKKRIEAAGGKFFFTLGKSKEEANFEVKFKDPDGVIFDISEKGWLK